jgi:hypothetical protein
MTAPIAQLVPAAAGTGWTWLQPAVEMAALLSGYWPVEAEAAAAGTAGDSLAGHDMAGGGQAGHDMAGGQAGSGQAGSGGAGSWSRVPRVATRTPSLTPHSIAAARTFTLRTLSRWGAEDCADDVAAVMSELLTNALRHAMPAPDGASAAASVSPIRLGLLHPGPCVLCAVADPSNLLPVPRQPDWLAESGRGLQVVASLSHRWGYCPAPQQRGKVVWATLLTSSRRP